MAFGKKKSSAETEQSVQTGSKKAGKKKKGGMSSILKESVLETVLSELAENEAFITQRYGDTTYVGLLLKASDIGGIDKKSNKDEAKGSIIEMINSGRIKTLLTAGLLEEETMVIIPEAITLDAMDEFSLLTEAPYELCYIDTSGVVEGTDIMVSYQDIANLVVNGGHVSTLLGSDEDDIEDEELVEEEQQGYTQEYLDNVTISMPNNQDIWVCSCGTQNTSAFCSNCGSAKPGTQQTMSEDDEQPFGDDFVGEDYEEEVYQEDTYEDESVYADEQSYEGETSDSYEEESAEEYAYYDDEGNPIEDEIPESMVEEMIMRRFYSDDLGLEITTEPFDAQFVHGNPYVPFNENRGEGWINQYLNEQSRDANIEMQRMHQDHLFRMRERYFKLVAMHCEEIQKALDIHDESTQFGQMNMSLKKQKLQMESEVDERVAKRKNELESAWEQKLNQVADDAARAARQQYRERFGRQHDEELYHLEPGIRDDIEGEFQEEIRNMHELRRAEASKRLDLGITEVLVEISEMYSELLDKENARYQELHDGIRRYLDENRKDDIEYRKVIEEEQRQIEKADKVTAEFTEKINHMTSTFDAKKAELYAEIEKMERMNEQLIQDKELEYQSKLEANKRKVDELQAQLDKLMEDYTKLDDKKSAEYGARIKELQNERVAWEEKSNHLIAVHKNSNKITALLVVVSVITSLCIGYIGGQFIASKMAKDNTTNTMVQQFDESVKELNESTDEKISSARQEMTEDEIEKEVEKRVEEELRKKEKQTAVATSTPEIPSNQVVPIPME